MEEKNKQTNWKIPLREKEVPQFLVGSVLMVQGIANNCNRNRLSRTSLCAKRGC